MISRDPTLGAYRGAMACNRTFFIGNMTPNFDVVFYRLVFSKKESHYDFYCDSKPFSKWVFKNIKRVSHFSGKRIIAKM